jgi:hypothetical protein
VFDTISSPFKALVIVGLIGGTGVYGYFKGAERSELVLADYRAEAEKQISTLKTKNEEISSKVVTQYVTKTNTIREKEVVYKEAAENLGSQHDMSNGWIYLHDASARLIDPDMEMAYDKAPSGVMDNYALAVVLKNYAICKVNAERLTQLQQWVRENSDAVDQLKADEK